MWISDRAWAEAITGVPRERIIAVAREFANNAEQTKGKSMVILGAGLNHWYNMDMNYRGIINLLVMCGCICRLYTSPSPRDRTRPRMPSSA